MIVCVCSSFIENWNFCIGNQKKRSFFDGVSGRLIASGNRNKTRKSSQISQIKWGKTTKIVSFEDPHTFCMWTTHTYTDFYSFVRVFWFLLLSLRVLWQASYVMFTSKKKLFDLYTRFCNAIASSFLYYLEKKLFFSEQQLNAYLKMLLMTLISQCCKSNAHCTSHVRSNRMRAWMTGKTRKIQNHICAIQQFIYHADI